jgi:hypothetical protein
MSLDVAFGHQHTLDLGETVDSSEPLQGVVFESLASTRVQGESYGVLRCIGVTRPELEFGLKHGPSRLLARLKKAGIYPRTAVNRPSTI